MQDWQNTEPPKMRMRPLALRLATLCALAAATGCGPGADDTKDAGGDGGAVADGACPAPETVTESLPESLACTGLFTSVADKTVAPGVREFAPAAALWTDGAEKSRWIWMPEGAAIDGTDPDDWKFPALTRLYKEFRWKGKRIETRVFWKVRSGFWLKATYKWNDDETEAIRFPGGPVELDGYTYQIPTAKMCDQCHKGRTDRSLGFEPVLLGLPGATGVTLKSLVDDGLLANYDGPTELEVGDDGTGLAAEALPWLHVNCGVSCHNRFRASEAQKTGFYMRLLYDELDGSGTRDTDVLATGLSQFPKTRRWRDQMRLIPGNAEDSLMYYLVTTRDAIQDEDRMPPIGTSIVPDEAAKMLKAWIEAMPPADDGTMDAGLGDAGTGDPDPMDAGLGDAGADDDQDAGE